MPPEPAVEPDVGFISRDYAGGDGHQSLSKEKNTDCTELPAITQRRLFKDKRGTLD